MDRNVTLTVHRLEESDDGWLAIQWLTKDLSPEGKLTAIFSKLHPDRKKVLIENAGIKDDLLSLKGKSFFTRIYRSGTGTDWKVDPASIISTNVELPKNKDVAASAPTALGLALAKADILKTIMAVEPKSNIKEYKAIEVKRATASLEDKTKSGKRGADTKVLKMIRNNCETLIGREFFAQDRPEVHRKVLEFFNALNAELAK